MSKLPYNKACALEDFSDPELSAILREVYAHETARFGTGFPAGAEHRKHWEVAMSLRALRDFGALRPDAEILGVGAGMEMTIFHLTRHVRRVVATDLYLSPGWIREAHPLMVTEPERLSPIPFERDRLIVQHMDGRWLRFPDASFSGVFSSGSIEHFGDLEDIAAAAFEMGRVLAPGGLLVLSTELLLAGPPGSAGWPGTRLLSPEAVRRFLIEASGLEPVDAPGFEVSERTLATVRPLDEVARERENGREVFPHLVLTHGGQVFGSVHLTLRKTERSPFPDNAWARPSEALRERVRRGEAEVGRRLLGLLSETPAPEPVPPPAAPAPAPLPPAEDFSRIEDLYQRWDALRARSGLEAPSQGSTVRRAAGFMGRTATRVRDLGASWDLQRDLLRALIDRQVELDQHLRGLEGLTAEVAGLRISDGEVRGAIAEIRGLIRADGTAPGEANLRDRQEVLRVRQARLEGDLADLREEIAALRVQAPEAAGAGAAHPLPLTARDFAELLATLKNGESGAVEVSLQDVRAEDLLLVARRHFGGRLSAAGPEYRSPNDLWIHVDFTAHWDRPILLENAAARLAADGRFLLITAPAGGEPPRHARLTLQEDSQVALAAGGAVRVLSWRKA